MPPIDEPSLQSYFQDKLDRFGFTPRGVDWNSVEAQENRFAQLARVIAPGIPLGGTTPGTPLGGVAPGIPLPLRPPEGVSGTPPAEPFSLLDYGSGFGALYDFLVRLGYRPLYTGFDFVPAMVAKGRETHPADPNCAFTADESALVPVDIVIASGIFNIRLETSEPDWRDYVLSILTRMDALALKGFAFNMLTSYSDPEYMKSHLYYADPCFYFDYCKRHFSKSVALLHDYGLYDFTILVRK